MQRPLAVLSVTNDLSTDRRVDKVARSLIKLGYRVTLVGRRRNDSLALENKPYECERLLLLFDKGPLFYAEFNIRLFFYLLRQKARVFVANDLDTLTANFLASRLKATALVYDSHELFTEVPELTGRKGVQQFWKKLEGLIFPRLEWIFTVNHSIADIYRQKYHKEIRVVRNLPERSTQLQPASREELGLPLDKPILILQGAGINIDRGAEEAILAMQYLKGTLLLIIGGGDMIDKLKELTSNLELGNSIRFLPKMPYEKLLQYTRCADIGLTLDKDSSLNYRFSLPNKLFDYIIAGIPVLASPLPEVSKVVNQYQIGMLIHNHEPEHIAKIVEIMLVDKNQMEKWKENLNIAASELCWEEEEKNLADVYSRFL
ncbi:MAG TPA: glycosyltransferase [Bacteroidales bacterium]|nr:glycosyltransferase [Bacteroidales bacterium]HSA43212.1 glycosyltransferase [Bacteroidales bacterium]